MFKQPDNPITGSITTNAGMSTNSQSNSSITPVPFSNTSGMIAGQSTAANGDKLQGHAGGDLTSGVSFFGASANKTFGDTSINASINAVKIPGQNPNITSANAGISFKY